MTNKKLKSYTTEFKESAVKLAVDSKQSIPTTAKELEINANTLYTWISKYYRPKPAGNPGQGTEHLYDELKRLRKEITQLKEERTILKKAAAFFAKESR